MPIPFVEEKLVEHLIVEAAVEGVVAQGFLLSDLHFGLGAEQLLLCDLFLFNGSAIFLGDLQACEVETAHFHVIKFVEFFGDRALHQGGDVVPFGGNGDELVLGEDRLQGFQQ